MDFTVERIASKDGKAFIREHHYSHGIHNGPMCWGMLASDRSLVGVCAFATPCSENVRASIFGPGHKDRVTELHRLALLPEVPRMGATWLIARALRGLHEYRPALWCAVSFADATQGHIGTIYQASNAVYYGTSGRATFFLDATGRLRHPRQNGHNVTKDEAAEWGWTPTKREAKHRYLLWLPGAPRSARKMLRVEPRPYPKAA